EGAVDACKNPNGSSDKGEKKQPQSRNRGSSNQRHVLSGLFRVHLTVRAGAPNGSKLSDGGMEAAARSTAARGEGRACALADAVTEPVEPGAARMTETDNTAVRCSAGLGDVGTVSGCIGWRTTAENHGLDAECEQGDNDWKDEPSRYH